MILYAPTSTNDARFSKLQFKTSWSKDLNHSSQTPLTVWNYKPLCLLRGWITKLIKHPLFQKKSIESTAPSSRVEDIPTVPWEELSPRVQQNAKIYDTQSSIPKQHEKPSFPAIKPIYRHPTRLKIAKAASSLQLEEAQVKKNKPVTIHLDSNVTNPPNQLSYKNYSKLKIEMFGQQDYAMK